MATVVTTTTTITEPPNLAAEILATMREPLALLDERLRLVQASPAFFLRFGLERERSLGASVFELGDGEWETQVLRHLLERLAPIRETLEDMPVEIRGARNERPRVRVSVRPVREGRNAISAYLLSFAEDEAGPPAASARLIERVRRAGGDLIAVLDVETWCFAQVEGASRPLLGYSGRELAGLSLHPFLHPSERDGILASLSGLAAGDPHLRISFRLRTRDGRYLWVEALCHAWVEENGPILVHLVARDVSERRRAEEALRWLGRQTKLILDSAADCIFGIDAAGRITFFNPAAGRALGYRVPELLGRDYRVLVDDSPNAEDVVALTLHDGIARTAREHTFRCGDGTLLLVEASVSTAREHDGIAGAVVIFRAIAERKRAEAAALRAEWLAGVGETAIAIRHEVNNPLTTLLAEARLLEMGGNTPAEEREMVAAIADQARRIGDVVRRLSECQNDPRVRMDGRQRMLDLG